VQRNESQKQVIGYETQERKTLPSDRWKIEGGERSHVTCTWRDVYEMGDIDTRKINFKHAAIGTLITVAHTQTTSELVSAMPNQGNRGMSYRDHRPAEQSSKARTIPTATIPTRSRYRCTPHDLRLEDTRGFETRDNRANNQV